MKTQDCWNKLIEIKKRHGSLTEAVVNFGYEGSMVEQVVKEGERIISAQAKYDSDKAYNENIEGRTTIIDNETIIAEEKILEEVTSEILDIETVLENYLSLD